MPVKKTIILSTENLEIAMYPEIHELDDNFLNNLLIMNKILWVFSINYNDNIKTKFQKSTIIFDSKETYQDYISDENVKKAFQLWEQYWQSNGILKTETIEDYET